MGIGPFFPAMVFCSGSLECETDRGIVDELSVLPGVEVSRSRAWPGHSVGRSNRCSYLDKRAQHIGAGDYATEL